MVLKAIFLNLFGLGMFRATFHFLVFSYYFSFSNAVAINSFIRQGLL